MGTRKPDTVRQPPMPARAVTLAEMRAAGWMLRATCSRCRVQLHVDLAPMIALLGPDYVLWGRHPRCRVWAWGDDERCWGRILFEARSVRGGSWRALKHSSEVADAIDLRRQLYHGR
ncbi:hypothetical protein [Brevundimonas bacteroides]|uniref:hypothetical protein n=1 Tax=Brevundimonas bacteroides TaxID=74311 RepID=UPI0004951896|nr:hypothetical protein [Brevundimonas bacteroides]